MKPVKYTEVFNNPHERHIISLFIEDLAKYALAAQRANINPDVSRFLATYKRITHQV